jgi:ABC-type transport system involved in cytochrome c biogenesis permease subunit
MNRDYDATRKVKVNKGLHIQSSVESSLIYAAMIVLVVGLILSALRKSKWAASAAFGAFIVLLAAWIFRWINAAHLPMQTMFDVFLTLGVCLFPVGVVVRKLKGSDTFNSSGDIVVDLILAFVILFPAGFVFSDQPQALPPVLQSPLFGPHVLAYLLSYVLMAKAAVYAAAGLMQKRSGKTISYELRTTNYELFACLLSCLGFPLMCLGLMLGSVWGLLAWGDWWNWDPKELWSLACVLVYAFYFHWRSCFGQKLIRVNCFLILLGFVFILITLLWVNVSRLFPGLHNYAG